MKIKRFIKRFFISIIALAYVAVLALCCISGPVAEDGKTGTSYFGTPKISFTNGSFKTDVTEMTLVLEEGETELLKNFTILKKADFSGSRNYSEIADWAAKNPGVDVAYTVVLPNGLTVPHDTATLDFSGIDSATLIASVEFMKHLPDVSSINLGQAADENSALTAEALGAISAACPEAEISYSFYLHGQALTLDAESVDLTGISSEEVDTAATILSCLKNIKTVELGSSDSSKITWEEIGKLSAACPEAELFYKFKLYDQDVNFQTESMDFSYKKIEDKGEALRAALPYMKKCSFVNMDSCGISNEVMGSLQEQFPDTQIVWRVWFGTAYSVRTDVVKILASKPSKGGVLGDEINDVLKYCTKVKYLDLGHNENISDISFVSHMPELEVLVIAMNPMADISPLANCPKLEYAELNSTKVSDLSPLANAKNLRHLNLGNCPNVSDISPLYGLTELERLWLGNIDPVPAEQVEEMKKHAPNCVIDTTTTDPTQGGWRFADLNDAGWYTWAKYGYFTFENHPRYELLRQQFEYDLNLGAYSFYYNDPTYLGGNP